MPKTKNKNTDLIEKHQSMVQFLQNIVLNLDLELKRVKIILSKLNNFDPNDPLSLDVDSKDNQELWIDDLESYIDGDMEVVEWYFDGYFMIDKEQKKYPVPLNYSSKTKLVPWDKLKLKIMADGKFIYKLINPVDRKHIKATLSRTDDQKYIAITEEWNTYFLNQAAVTFFKGKPWDELYIVVNSDEEKNFCAIEAVIKK